MAKTVKFSDAEKKDILLGIARTWHTLAGDFFMSLSEMNIRSVPRSHVVELVLDADYLESYGGVSKVIIEKFRTLPYAEQVKTATSNFPHKRYSL